MNHTIFMTGKLNKKIFVFGNNEYGQLGLGNHENQNKPVLLMQDESIQQIICGGHQSMILKKNGELLVFGHNEEGQLGLGNNERQNKPVVLMQDEGIKQIVCGGYHSMILKKNGELFVFGYNEYGQLGLGNNKDKNKPRKLMSNVTLLPVSTNINQELTPYEHKYFSVSFQERIYTFMLVLKRCKLEKIIPKFIRFEIIKKCI